LEVTIREILAESNEGMLFADGFDEALVGIVERGNGLPVALYDTFKCIEVLMDEGMTEEDAWDHFCYNVLGSYVGEYTPAFMTFTRDLTLGGESN
jgi:hypothetical protein